MSTKFDPPSTEFGAETTNLICVQRVLRRHSSTSTLEGARPREACEFVLRASGISIARRRDPLGGGNCFAASTRPRSSSAAVHTAVKFSLGAGHRADSPKRCCHSLPTAAAPAGRSPVDATVGPLCALRQQLPLGAINAPPPPCTRLCVVKGAQEAPGARDRRPQAGHADPQGGIWGGHVVGVDSHARASGVWSLAPHATFCVASWGHVGHPHRQALTSVCEVLGRPRTGLEWSVMHRHPSRTSALSWLMRAGAAGVVGGSGSGEAERRIFLGCWRAPCMFALHVGLECELACEGLQGLARRLDAWQVGPARLRFLITLSQEMRPHSCSSP